MKTWLRTVASGAATTSGIKKLGFFIPYAQAASVVSPPPPYEGLERIFEAATPDFDKVLSGLVTYADALSDACAGPLKDHWNGGYFGPNDTAAAFTPTCQSRPRRIIEVGSGSSTHVLAAAGATLETPPEMICIDPVPRSDISDLGVDFLADVLSDAHIGEFEQLEAGDIAFFDSSHVLFEGTDVDIIQNRILPILKPGVLVHIHDIFLPDPYPVEWSHRAYTEQSGLGGWIAGGAYDLVYSSYYVGTRMADRTTAALNALRQGPVRPSGGLLWFRRAG